MSPTRAPSGVLEAQESFICEIAGTRYTVTKGLTRIAAEHTLNAHYPHHFRPVEDNLSFPVVFPTEEASDEPGRSREKPAAPKGAKKASTDWVDPGTPDEASKE